MQKFSLVIPVFNEKDNLLNLMNDIVSSKVYELLDDIIFINDCSTDGSDIILKNISRKYKKSIVLNHNKNLGQSHSLLTGISESNSENIITIDSDGQNPPKEIINMINIYNSFKDPTILCGIRTKRQDNFIKIVSSKIANKIRNFIVGDNCPDAGCSLKVFRRKDFLSLPFFNGIHRFLPALFLYQNIEVNYINVSHKKRLYGISKYGTIDRLVKTIYDLFIVIKIKKKLNKK